jgi:uncharacterized protein (DUF305 family)
MPAYHAASMIKNEYFSAAVCTLCCLLLTACAAAAPAIAVTPTTDSMAGMSHGSMDGPAVTENFDAKFIDSMIVHHQSAIAMANQALTNTQRPELQTLARAIVTAQQGEIEQMQAWRTAWYPDLPATGGLAMSMGEMSVKPGDAPYDIRFVDAMIPHHEGAVAMAQAVLTNSKRPELLKLAADIIAAQNQEITQMRAWRTAWMPK